MVIKKISTSVTQVAYDLAITELRRKLRPDEAGTRKGSHPGTARAECKIKVTDLYGPYDRTLVWTTRPRTIPLQPWEELFPVKR